MTSLLQVLQLSVITGLLFISGLSFCLSTWVIPVALIAPTSTQIDQFLKTVSQGFQYLQPSSRVLGLGLLLTTLLTYFNGDASVNCNWGYWAASLAILAPVAPYEVYFIFPINDEIKAMKNKDGVVSSANEKRTRQLMESWRMRNFGRVVLPFLVGVSALCSLL